MSTNLIITEFTPCKLTDCHSMSCRGPNL